ncbi:MAG TPA: M23 family metallopeptidase [Gemmatimonadaceae bacterium]|nr:M23 family metallopeptidase [Gemmatimonadaceae bacterium]
MFLPTRLPLILAGAVLASGCIQTLAPVVVPSPSDGPAPRVASGPSAASDQPAAAPAPAPDASRFALATAAGADATLVSHDLALPVAGVSPLALQDSFDAGREGGRVHHAIDIMAPRGTPVLAADDGRVLRLSSNTLGGITVYTIDRSGQFVYYYAHLEGYKAGLVTGDLVARGDTLGYVGTTGDAPENLPHLHFQILRMPANGRYWEGDPIDPFPLLSERGTRIVGH